MRRSSRLYLLLSCLSLAAMVAGAFLDVGRPVALALVFGGLACLLLFLILLGLSLAKRCPHCGWPIPARFGTHTQINIRRCPRCGAILEDHSARN